jgi:hypothetical protein
LEILLGVLVVIMTTGGIVTTAVLLRHNAEIKADVNADSQNFIDIGTTTAFVDAASLILQHNGVAGLRRFLVEVSRQQVPPIFAVNESGQDVLAANYPLKSWTKPWQRVNPIRVKCNGSKPMTGKRIEFLCCCPNAWMANCRTYPHYPRNPGSWSFPCFASPTAAIPVLAAHYVRDYHQPDRQRLAGLVSCQTDPATALGVRRRCQW